MRARARIMVLGKSGIITRFLVGSYEKSVYGFWGSAVVQTLTFFPVCYRMLEGLLKNIDPSLEEAARDLGASPQRAFFTVTLPLILPAVLSGVLLAFAMSMDDVVISFFVTGTTSNTLPLQVYSMLKMGVTPEVNALCTLMLLVVFGAIGLFYLLSSLRRKAR